MLEWASGQPAGGPRVELVGIPDQFQEHASRAQLLAGMGLDAAGLTARIRRCVEGEGRSRAQSAS